MAAAGWKFYYRLVMFRGARLETHSGTRCRSSSVIVSTQTGREEYRASAPLKHGQRFTDDGEPRPRSGFDVAAGEESQRSCCAGPGCLPTASGASQLHARWSSASIKRSPQLTEPAKNRSPFWNRLPRRWVTPAFPAAGPNFYFIHVSSAWKCSPAEFLLR